MTDGGVHYELRTATPEDELFLSRLFAEVHSGEFAALGFSPDQLNTLLNMQARAQQLSYAATYPDAQHRIVLQQRSEGVVPIGRILSAEHAGGVQLIDIALLPSAQNRGIGTSLLEGLLADAARQKQTVRLSVRSGSRAFHLYNRLGFRVVAEGAQLDMEYVPPGDSAVPDISGPADRKGEGEQRPGMEWESRLGTKFVVEGTPAEFPSLLLADFQRSRRDPATFSLIFHGALSPVLAQQIHSLREETGADAQSDEIFLVAIGPQGDVMLYESVFNLGTGRPS